MATQPEVDRIVVIGAGQAGFQTCASLRDNGFTGDLTLIGEEGALPYERPPLSKGYLLGETDIELRPRTFYEDKAINLVVDRVTGIDRREKVALLETGPPVAYDRLVLATGARARTLSVPGSRLSNVLTLRTISDAEAIRWHLHPDHNVVIVGAGFIGLEVASLAREIGCHTTVVESLPHPMSRVVTVQTSTRLAAGHARMGTAILLNRKVTGFDGAATGAVTGVVLDDGTRLAADVVIAGVGVVPNVELAFQAGLFTSDGVMVDEFLRTSDPDIYAIGDCARFPSSHAGGLVRLESVQNATDQARCVAATLTGQAAPYTAVPWFWSDQCGVKLQIAGLAAGHDQAIVKEHPASGGFSVFCFKAGRLVAVESVNRPVDHIFSRRMLAGEPDLTPEEVAAADFDLKTRNYQPA